MYPCTEAGVCLQTFRCLIFGCASVNEDREAPHVLYQIGNVGHRVQQLLATDAHKMVSRTD